MRRFMVHLVTEVEFEDGDEASDKTCRTTRSSSRRPFGTPPKGSCSGQSRAPGSRVSRSQKSKPSSSNPPTCGLNHAQQTRAANDASEHAQERRPRGHGDVRSL
jgi:hypothetical protein